MKRKTWVTFDHQFTFATTRPKRHGRWLLAALLLTLIGTVLAYSLARQATRDAPKSLRSAAAPVLTPVAAAAQPSGSKVHVVVRRNDTIEGIFRNLKLSAADLKAVLSVPGVGHVLKQLQPGDKITVVHNGAELHAINRYISETEVLAVTRNVSGFAAERIITLSYDKAPQMGGNDRSS